MRELAEDTPVHPEPSRPAAEHVADRAEVTAADLEAERDTAQRLSDDVLMSMGAMAEGLIEDGHDPFKYAAKAREHYERNKAERDTLRAALRQAKRDVIAIHQAGFDSKRLKACQDAIARIEEALGGVSGRQEQGRDAAA